MPVDRAMWRRCRALVDALEIPSPFDPSAFVSSLAAHRGRPVELVPLDRPTAQCGALVATEAVDYIFYAAATTRLHQEHILLHEVGHLLCDHVGVAPLPGFTLLSPELVQRVLNRSDYSAEQEAEAELVGSMISQRAQRRSAPVTRELADGIARLGSVFDVAP